MALVKYFCLFNENHKGIRIVIQVLISLQLSFFQNSIDPLLTEFCYQDGLNLCGGRHQTLKKELIEFSARLLVETFRSLEKKCKCMNGASTKLHGNIATTFNVQAGKRCYSGIKRKRKRDKY